jgi:hypothetical protein
MLKRSVSAQFEGKKLAQPSDLSECPSPKALEYRRQIFMMSRKADWGRADWEAIHDHIYILIIKYINGIDP